ncbi:unnamed protein product [Moneuplotes crassus]|uniref:3-hydroxyisobutyrate dehydrogenase n=1 Tax=Euplotes crassus TaxID=5936 RepID=A0AAD1XIN1_EUPCR|nr:unnamed protein product [Moneuplotes crassus]
MFNRSAHFASKRLSTLSKAAFSSCGGRDVGFIGLGNMGIHMVRHCINNGNNLTVFDVNEKVLQQAEQMGAKVATSVKEVAQGRDVVMTIVPNTEIVQELRLGTDGIFENAREGALIIDSSTISPTASAEMSEHGEKIGLRVVDAPVCGAQPGAMAGTLTFLVGCKDEYFEDCKSFLPSMGKKIYHTGAPGTGQVAKICNNLMLAIQMVAVSEGISLGEKLGLDPKILEQVIGDSTAACWAMNLYNPKPGVKENVPSANEYNGGFATSLMKKDLNLALDGASSVDLHLGFVSKAKEYLTEVEKLGKGEKDFGYVYQYVKDLKS